MKTPKELRPLVAAIRSLQNLIDRFDQQGIIIGGVAVGLLSKPRLTADADAVIFLSIADLESLLDAAKQEGFEPRYPNVPEFARAHRLVALVHEPSGVHVDVSLGAMPFETEAIQRSNLVKVGRLQLRIPSVEDLIILKGVAHREKDSLDIQTLIEFHPNLDRARIEYWMKEFALVLEMPELWDDVAKLLQR